MSCEDKEAFCNAVRALNYDLYTVPEVTLDSVRPFEEKDLNRTIIFDLFAVPR